LIDFANNVGGFDLIIGDHTNVEYSGIHGKALVVENLSKGVTYARVQMTVDPHNGRVIDRSVDFVPAVSSDVTPDPAIVALLQPFRDELDDLLNVVVGESTVMIPRADACGTGNGRTCESLVGNSTTDSMRLRYGTDFAITNAGGLRADLTCPIVDNPTDFCPPFSGPNFDITAGQVLTVLPFGNQVVTYDLNGAELKDMLENGVSAMPGISGRFAQVSGLCFTYDIAASAGSRVSSAVRQAEDGSCTGDAVDLTAGSTYSVSSNDFMASGGDGYPDFSARMTSRELMDQVLSEYVTDNSPISPTIQGRINCVGSTCPTELP
jgi:2',3'-cyclic-nucleotide 2'-phosphodiesterase (5'-nucleotidase family)